MPQKAARCRRSRNIRGMKITASAQLSRRKSRNPGTRAESLMLAKSLLHPLMPPLIVTLQAVRIDAVQHLHAATGPLRYLRTRSARIQPPRHPGMTEVVRPAGQRRGDLRRSERLHARLRQHPPQRGRLVSGTAVGKEQLTPPDQSRTAPRAHGAAAPAEAGSAPGAPHFSGRHDGCAQADSFSQDAQGVVVTDAVGPFVDRVVSGRRCRCCWMNGIWCCCRLIRAGVGSAGAPVPGGRLSAEPGGGRAAAARSADALI